MKKIYKWFSIFAMTTPIIFAFSAGLPKTSLSKLNNENENTTNASEEEIDITKTKESLTEQLNNLPLYSPLYRKDTYDQFFENLGKQQAQYISEKVTEEEFKNQVQILKEFYRRVFELHLILQTNNKIELEQKLKELRDTKNTILIQINGDYKISTSKIKSINLALVQWYASGVEEAYKATNHEEEQNQLSDQTEDNQDQATTEDSAQ
ncbi:hypothetical protein [Mycoplasmopsis sturni]|uniref:hypothetical protein n=1 Tax=Mycoplasmopsis sturni TaxID=39047 RepID=UPI00055B65A7|nr:hypothetical protein [Mycoplasmopsis sturni]